MSKLTSLIEEMQARPLPGDLTLEVSTTPAHEVYFTISSVSKNRSAIIATMTRSVEEFEWAYRTLVEVAGDWS